MTDRTLGPVVLDADVAVPRRDGLCLRADVYRPVGQGRVPALIMRLPYDKRRAQSYWYSAPAWYAERGYAVVVEDVRGQHRSPGDFRPLAHEAADGADLIRWVAEQPWCDGAVGSYGYSYSGLAQMLAAGSAHDVPLRAMAPALSPPGLGEGCLFQGGVPAAAFLLTWAAELGGLRLDLAVDGGRHWSLNRDLLRHLVLSPLTDFTSGVSEEAWPWLEQWLTGALEDAYWHDTGHRPDYERIGAESLHLAGWYDTFRTGAIGHFQRLQGVPTRAPGTDRLVVGPWTHQPVIAGRTLPLAGPGARAWQVDDIQMQFFDTVLRGEDAPPEPPVRVAVLNSGETWTGAEWPPPGALPTVWWLGSEGRANGRDGNGTLSRDGARPSRPDHLVYDHANPVPAVGGDDCGDPQLVGMGPADQEPVEQRPDVLVYTSPARDSEVVIAGNAEVVLYVETVDPVSQWLARLCLVTSDGLSVNIAESVVRCTSDLGGPTRVTLTIGPVAFRLRRGERLRLHVTQGSSPRWGGLRDQNGVLAVTRSVVLHEPDHPSSLHLAEIA
jgi:putative CocE/NonD family hydrolase